nr:hypothetical protein [Tanacetum cinerariifolium]
MLKGFDRENLVALWNLVKEKFSSAVSSVDKEKALWVELKRLFKPDADDVLWKLQRKLKFICHWANPVKDFKWSNVSRIKLSLFFESNDTFTSLQALSNLHYLFNGLWIISGPVSCMIKSLKLPKSGNQLRFLIQRVPSGRTSNALSIPRKANLYGERATGAALGTNSIWNSTWQSEGRPGLSERSCLLAGMKNYQYWLLIAPSGWSFVSVVPSQMTHLVASITLDSARSCVMQGAFLTHGTVSSIPTVLSWGSSIRPEGFRPFILLLSGPMGLVLDFDREMARLSIHQLESFKKLRAKVEVLGSHSTQDTPTVDPKEISKEDVKNMLQIVLVSEFKVKALQVKYPLIESEIHSEGSRSYWKIIRVGRITQAYRSFEDMVKDFNIEDLDALWRLKKEKFSVAIPTEDKEKALWVELKRLHDIFVFPKKYYPLTDVVLLLMLNSKLQVDEDTTPIKQYTRRARIAQSSALPTIADELASPQRDVSQKEACPTDSGFIADPDRATIDKSSTLPYDSAPHVTSLVADEGNDASIKGRSMDEGEAAIERISDDSEEMATVLNSMDAATVFETGVVDVPTGSGFISTASTPAEEQVPTGSDVVPTASLVFATATVVTPYRRRKGKEVMAEFETLKKQRIAKDAEIARIHAEEDLQIMINGLDRNNETVAKYLQEYHQFASELPIERRIELITDLVKYQDNYAKNYKYQRWKVKDFRGMTFKEVEAKFNSVWKQMEDFIPMGLKEEAKRIKRKGLNLEQESAKKQKISEEVPEEVMSSEEVLEEKVKEMMQLVPIEEVYVEALQVKHLIIDWNVYTKRQRSYWKIIRLGSSPASYQFFIDLLKHLDREDLNQL